ncbi:MAG: prepilin-type N-terminal cleavage/methylation domain-containing protein [Opitutaceae bacterium]|jgi:prepilin-type N-terminal cleavage/methylation domain-containing protein|nr:prepilin-type N-terminal cleavage/methylation domain-containing protein [Opitutaceae bacterium]
MNHKHRTPRHDAFTLIELLAVITIIGILAAILIPTVGAVRQKAKGVQCISNLRGLFVAINLFANEWKHYPTMNCENIVDPSRSGSPQSGGNGSHAWFVSLIEQGYLPVQKEVRGGEECRVARIMICPANDYQGEIYSWINAPKPWQGNYMTSRYYGASGYSAKPVRIEEATNVHAILLADTRISAYGVWNNGDADWDNTNCRVPKGLHGAGAHALFISGKIATITPATHPDLPNERNWNPRYGN